jgi:hypothetical protein
MSPWIGAALALFFICCATGLILSAVVSNRMAAFVVA